MTIYTSTDNAGIWALLILLFIALIVVGVVVFVKVFNAKRDKIVESNSKYIEQIKIVNTRFHFVPLRRETDLKIFRLSSKRSFDTFDFQTKAIAHIKDNFAFYYSLVQTVESNIKIISSYKKEISQLEKTVDPKIAETCKMSLNSFAKRQDKIANRYIQNPTMAFKLRIREEYTSPAGRNHYEYHRDYVYSEIKQIVFHLAQQSSNDVKVKEVIAQRYTATMDDIPDVE